MYDARCEELFVGVRTLANCCADEGEEACDEEDGPFAVFAGDGAVEGATDQYRGITNARILRSIYIHHRKGLIGREGIYPLAPTARRLYPEITTTSVILLFKSVAMTTIDEFKRGPIVAAFNIAPKHRI